MAIFVQPESLLHSLFELASINILAEKGLLTGHGAEVAPVGRKTGKTQNVAWHSHLPLECTGVATLN